MLVRGIGGVERTGRDNGVEHFVDVRANDDLILATRVHNLHDAFGRLEDLIIPKGLILELEAKAGDAMGDALDVAGTADVFEDDAGKGVISSCHGFDPFSSERFVKTMLDRRAGPWQWRHET